MNLSVAIKTLTAKEVINKYCDGTYYKRKDRDDNSLNRKIVKIDFEKDDIYWQDQFGLGLCTLSRFEKLCDTNK